MTSVSHLQSLYSVAPVILWVEDHVTWEYIRKVWGEPQDVSYLISGGDTVIHSVVQDAKAQQLPHVFGLVDRDFRSTNYPHWLDPQTRVFRLPRHEIENYLLDPDAVAGCQLNNRQRSIVDVEQKIRELAQAQPYWLACRRILLNMRKDIQGDYPGPPPLTTITSLADANKHITTSNWFQHLVARCQQWNQPNRVQVELQQAHLFYSIALQNADWLIEFSGKEIFRPLRDYVYQPRGAGHHDGDFAAAIGDWQYKNQQQPADLMHLLSTMKQRVGLIP